MKVKPLGTRVLVMPKKTEDKTKGGIYIPDTAKEKTQEGTIKAVGDSKDMTVKAGDQVLFESYAGTEIKIDGEKHLIMELKDILAIIQ